MVECIVTLCGGGISVHVPVLLDVEAVDAETMPSRFTGWLKRSFQETDIHRLLSSDGAKVLSVFEGRFSYILEIEDERSLRFVGTRIHVRIPMKSITRSELMPITFGAKRRRALLVWISDRHPSRNSLLPAFHVFGR